jgi:hydrogenase 3 maturation protease
MSSKSWTVALRRTLERSNAGSARVAVVGVGNSLRGDDGVGVHVTQLLRRGPKLPPRWSVIDGGSSPEACTAVLRRFAPHLVILADAVDLQALPGTIAWLETWTSDGLSSTHGLPLDVLASFLRQELGCDVGLLAIQPASVCMGEGLSRWGRRAARAAAAGLRHAASGWTQAGSTDAGVSVGISTRRR